ncbi:30S ribosomal protein S4 [Lachnospiraceae bacterium YH-ros2228]|jgi:small subunit ribosomal protein S4|nr:30S ribosomal protein S4 [Lachnospiraceae bacterium]MDD6451155.1 30S ribosomal protein S4 [Lachnospiraceae bacterium]
MAVNKTPILKRCRSLGMDPVYLGYDKKSKRHPQNSRRKVSEYGLQLKEKQKAKFIYGVLEKPFRNYYEKADRMKGQTGENLMTMLESRLDNIVFRAGFARTRREARQMVDHKLFTVNGKKINIPSYLCKAGDVIEAVENKKSLQRFKDIAETTNGRAVAEWLDVDAENWKATIKNLPNRDQIDVPVDELQIVELYSK